MPLDNALARVVLGRTGLQTSWLGLGTAPLGGLFAEVSEAQAEAVVERAWERGIRLFDTAPLYGFGLAERRLGRVLARRPRDEFVLTTKVGRLLRKEGLLDPSNDLDGEPIFKGVPDLRPVFDFSADGIQASLAESRQRLGIDRIDVAYVHDPDAHHQMARDVALPELRRLRAVGVLRGIGAGMNQCEMLADFVCESDVDMVLVAGRYSLLDRSAAGDLLPLCLERGIAVVVGGVFNSGVLADPHRGATYDYAPAPQAVLDRVAELRGICADHGVPLRAAAIQFVRRHPAVSAVLVGARSPQEVDDALEMGHFPVPEGLWSDLEGDQRGGCQ